MRYIKGFDALRALSIVFVMLNHLGLDGVISQQPFVRMRLWNLFSGETGVHIFFVLSGFLITTILLNEKAETGRINLKKFFFRRFLKLFPPMVVLFTIILFLVGFRFIRFDLPALLMSFFYLYNYVPLLHYISELAHTWSLAVEEQFYLAWPVILLLIRKYKKLLLVCCFFILISFVAAYTFPEFVFHAHSRPRRWFIPAAGHIFIGCFTAILRFELHETWKLKLHGSALPFILAIVLFAAPLYVPQQFIETSSLVQSFGISVLLLWIYYNQSHSFTRFIDFSGFVYIGRISYGLYIYQGLFLLTGPGSNFTFQQFPLNIILTFGTAILSCHLLEKPVMKLKKKPECLIHA